MMDWHYNKENPMKKVGYIVCLIFATVIIVSSCGFEMSTETNEKTQTEAAGETEEQMVYMSITAEQAKQLMDTESDYMILDVRTEEEYNESHIPNAILILDYEITAKAERMLADKDQLILVYCRSGRRSKNASQALAGLGYTNVKEFGGIIDWPYETE